MKLVVISPVRNEAAHLERTIRSVVRQELRPQSWVIVNDGSTDDTGKVIDAAAAAHPWIKAIHRDDRGFRQNGRGVMDAFMDGLRQAADISWDCLAKLDGDLEFGPEVFAIISRALAAEPKLGIAGGDVFHERDGREVIESAADPAFHVRGATKFYRRECWEAIGGLHPVTGWDTLDEVKANMLGWESRRIPEARFLHLRPTGGADGGWRNAFKNGRGSYISGYHPVYMLSKCVRRLPARPLLIQSLGLFSGYFSSYFAGVQRIADDRLIRFLRQQQLRRLFGLSSIWN